MTNISIKKVNDKTLLLKFSKYYNVQTSDDLRKIFTQEATHFSFIVLDCSELTDFESGGNELIFLEREFYSQGGKKVIYCSVSDRISRIFEILKMQIVKYDSREEALKSLE